MAEGMEIAGVARTVNGPTHAFTGDVYVTSIAEPRAESEVVAALVRFAPSARTHWHSHLRGQTLYITEGEGLIATRDGRVIRVRAGDTVWTPAGEQHWHGAVDSKCMSHIGFVQNDESGANTMWLEPVTEDDYRAAHSDS